MHWDTEEYRSRYWEDTKYFKFKDNTHSWVLPVYEGSYTAQHPAESFPWNKSCKFVGEVTEAEYNKQFEPVSEQLELF